MNGPVIPVAYRQLSAAQVERLIRLQDTVWPKPEKIARPMAERIESYYREAENGLEVFLLEDSDTLLAHAEIFPRTIATPAGNLEVMALASVCTPENLRGSGYGKRIVQSAFAEVDSGRFALSLFQTGVPEFYEKFGAVRVENPFINSRKHEGIDRQPWWNPYVMIYKPRPVPVWPEGEIDLLGPGY